MTGSNIDHMDVGAYALGVLSDWEATQFESHLADCDICGRELEELTMVTGLLSHVDADSILAVEQYDRDGRQLDRMLNVVSLDRRRARSQRILAAAAAVVVVVAGIAFGVVGLTRSDGGGTPQAGKGPAPHILTVSPAPQGAGTSNTNTDADTGVVATVTTHATQWGSIVDLSLSKVRGPLKCQLLAISGSDSEVVANWNVPDGGYGMPGQPKEFVTQGTSSFAPSQIQKFEVRVSKGNADKNPLVTVPAT
jgi:hypothetical protein